MTEVSPNTTLTLEELDTAYGTVDLLQARFQEIFGPRDSIYLDERHKRIRLFEIGTSDLFDQLRRTEDPGHLAPTFARVTSRIFSIANGIDGVLVSRGLTMKFSGDACRYCNQAPCRCGSNRPDPKLASDFDEANKDWSLRQWQKHLGSKYNEVNKDKGIGLVIGRLTIETSELIAVEDALPGLSQDEAVEHYSLEVADTMAWTIAAANLLGVDVQKATLERFGNGCSVCGVTPCQCSRHNFQPHKFE